MDKKILFFDVDGTILTEDTYEIPQSTKDAIRKARQNGHLAFINTGRTYGNIDDKIKEIGFDGYVCGCGIYIRIGDKECYYEKIPVKKCAEIIEKLREYQIEAALEGFEDVYFDETDNVSKLLLKMKEDFMKKNFGIRKNWNTPGLSFDKIFTISNKNSRLAEFIDYITAEFEYIDRGNGCGEVFPKGHSKATGIQFLLDWYGLPLENAFVFGDSSNDLAMFEYVPNSIAMLKCDACIREKASFITRDIREDGIYYAMKKYGVI